VNDTNHRPRSYRTDAAITRRRPGSAVRLVQLDPAEARQHDRAAFVAQCTVVNLQAASCVPGPESREAHRAALALSAPGGRPVLQAVRELPQAVA